MNIEQEKITVEIIKYLKTKGGVSTRQDIMNSIQNINSGWNHHTVIGSLKDLNLIDNIGDSAYRLTDNGWRFESFEKLMYEKRLNIDLAESNIEANKLNKKNSGFNKIATIINVIIGILNAILIVWQISQV